MEQIAEDMVAGCCCELCGMYFKDGEGNSFEHGYPVTCKDCWEELSEDEKSNRQRATTETF